MKVLTLTFSTLSISGTLKPAGLRRADDRAVAQPHAALGLIDGVPASCGDDDDDNDGDDGSDDRFPWAFQFLQM